MIDAGHSVLQSCHSKRVSSILAKSLSTGGGVTLFDDYCYYNLTTIRISRH